MSGTVLITGTAGFIGFHLARRLLAAGIRVVGLDNLNAYYDPALKRARLAALNGLGDLEQVTADIADPESVPALFARHRPEIVVHLAAQVGVRDSVGNARAYGKSNLEGFLSVLEACRLHPVRHLVYASSSSVYGSSARAPFAETDPVDAPVSLYAATKRANELMARAYAHLHAIPTTGLRFFTVYGPWGRPDMAVWRFTEALAEGREIILFNDGAMRRDFTYIDDVVEAVARVMERPPTAAAGEPPHAIYNVGNHAPIALDRLVDVVEAAIGRPARRLYRPMQPGDVLQTCADTRRLRDLVGFSPATSIETGIDRFVAWYRGYRERADAGQPAAAAGGS